MRVKDLVVAHEELSMLDTPRQSSVLGTVAVSMRQGP